MIARPGVTVARVTKPLGSYLLGRWPLRWAGTRFGRATLAEGGRVVVNGGNCPVPDVNWVHYVHAAYHPAHTGSAARRIRGRLERTLEARAERAAVRAARVVACNSERTRCDVIERLGIDPGRARTVYYGTDPGRFRPADGSERAGQRARLGWPVDRPVVVFVGGLGDRRKGFDTLFAAWASLCQSPDWDAILVVVGRGAELRYWDAQATTAGLADRVRFLGFRSDVPDLLRAADALVAPTRYEAYGLGVHEALCCGLPAIVSAAAGVAERYPPELADLLLPDPDDAADLAARLQRWRDDPTAVRARVAPLGEMLRAYTWDDMGQDFVAAIGDA